MLEHLLQWVRRRIRFSEEWEFHRGRLAAELTASGLSRREVRSIVNHRMGRRSRWKREALREIGGDWRALAGSLDWKRLPSTPWFAPAALISLLALLFIANPLRHQMLESLVREPGGYSPLRKLAIVPANFARLTWGVISLLEIAWLTQSRRGWRISAYAVLLWLPLAVLGIGIWVAAVQLWIAVRWPSDLLQGLAMLAFALAYPLASVLAAVRWRRSVKDRCPVCLRRLGSHILQGRSSDLLIDPLETESICFEGHGVSTESRWTRTFRMSAGFWEDLAQR